MPTNIKLHKDLHTHLWKEQTRTHTHAHVPLISLFLPNSTLLSLSLEFHTQCLTLAEKAGFLRWQVYKPSEAGKQFTKGLWNNVLKCTVHMHSSLQINTEVQSSSDLHPMISIPMGVVSSRMTVPPPPISTWYCTRAHWMLCWGWKRCQWYAVGLLSQLISTTCAGATWWPNT